MPLTRFLMGSGIVDHGLGAASPAGNKSSCKYSTSWSCRADLAKSSCSAESSWWVVSAMIRHSRFDWADLPRKDRQPGRS